MRRSCKLRRILKIEIIITFIALHLCIYYNLVKIHKTLRVTCNGRRLNKKLMGVVDIVNLVDK